MKTSPGNCLDEIETEEIEHNCVTENTDETSILLYSWSIVITPIKHRQILPILQQHETTNQKKRSEIFQTKTNMHRMKPLCTLLHKGPTAQTK